MLILWRNLCEGGQAGGNIYLNLDDGAFQPDYGAGDYFGQHALHTIAQTICLWNEVGEESSVCFKCFFPRKNAGKHC